MHFVDLAMFLGPGAVAGVASLGLGAKVAGTLAGAISLILVMVLLAPNGSEEGRPILAMFVIVTMLVMFHAGTALFAIRGGSSLQRAIRRRLSVRHGSP